MEAPFKLCNTAGDERLDTTLRMASLATDRGHHGPNAYTCGHIPSSAAAMPDLLAPAPAPGFDDPLGLLAACHRRIREKLETLERLQRHLPEHGHDAQARTAARGLLKYFDGAAPNHHADEEHSLFPRLAAHSADVRDLLNVLAREHVTLAAHWRRLRPMLASITAGRRANLSPTLVREVRALYERHLAQEDDLLLPLARDLLEERELEEMGREMAARRAALG